MKFREFREKETDRPRFPPIDRETRDREINGEDYAACTPAEIGEAERKLIEFVPDVGPSYRREYRKR